MAKIIFGIFAHPDDEAFGPAGTLLHETKNGAKLHLVSLTAGENGNNPDNLPNLSSVRLTEWHKAGELLGATEMHHLGYIDGKLDNTTFLEASTRIEQLILDVLSTQTEPHELEIFSMDTSGITGHIDHIVASRAAHQVFYRLKDQGVSVTRLRLCCITRQQTGDTPDTSFVFMEPGRLAEEIDETVDNHRYLDEVLAIMRCHHTQREDYSTHIEELGGGVAIDHFIVKR